MIKVTTLYFNSDLTKYEGEYITRKHMEETFEFGGMRDFKICLFQKNKANMFLDEELFIAEDAEVGEWVEIEDLVEFNLSKEVDEKYKFISMY